MRAERVINLFDILLAKQWSLIAEESVQSLGSEWQERREDDLERVNRFEGGEDRQRGGGFVCFDGGPRRVDVEILIDRSGKFHRFAQRRAQAHGFEFRAYSLESVFDNGEQTAV